MTPEEKAKELLNKFSSLNQWVGGEGNISLGTKMAKQCAIICVEQIIDSGVNWTPFESYFRKKTETLEYWQDVLSHLKNS